MTFRSSSSTETKRLGARLASALLARQRGRPRRRAVVIALAGELGGGKTTFTQGFARGIGARGRVASPTFIIMRRMKIRGMVNGERRMKSEERGTKKGQGKSKIGERGTKKGKQSFPIHHLSFSSLYHVDAYRLSKSREMQTLGFKSVLRSPQNVVLIEWPERIARLIPKSAMRIVFHHGEKENERTIELRNTNNLRMYEKKRQ